MKRILALVLLVFLASRVLVVLAMGDAFFYGEELEKGAVAEALLAGVDVPYARLPFHPYEGGGFVASHLKAVLFLALGPTVLAHKAAAILWGLLVVASATVFLGRHGGKGAALLGGLLVALGPAHFQAQSLLHLGIHFEALLFMALVWDLGARVAAVPAGESPRGGLLFGLGLASGLGTYFSYQVPVAVLSVIGLLALTGWRRIFAPPLVVGTLLGLAPLAAMALAVGSEIVDIHGSNVGGDGGFARFVDGLRAGLAHPTGRAFVGIGLVAVLLGLMADRPRGERARALGVLVLFVVLWVAVAIGTGMVQAVGDDPHWVRFIRFAPLVFGLLLIVGTTAGPAFARFGRGSVASRGAALAGGLLVVLGVFHAARAIQWGTIAKAGEHFETVRSVHGAELRGALVKIAPRLVSSEASDEERAAAAARFRAWVDRAPEGRRDFVVSEIVGGFAHDAGLATPDGLAAAMAGALGPDVPREAIVRGLGPVLYRKYGGDLGGALRDPGLTEAQAEALGIYGSGYLSLPGFVGSEVELARGTANGPAFLTGLGRRIFRCSVMQAYWGPELRLRPWRARGRLVEVAQGAGVTDPEIEALLAGFGAAARDFGVAGLP